MAAQGGLTPKNIVNLKGLHIKEIFDREKEPYKIDLPKKISKTTHSNHFSFVAEESKQYLLQYFEVRGVPSENELVFLPTRKDSRGGDKMEKKSLSIIFSETVKQLGLIPEEEIEERKGKPKTLRFYNLRKFFRKYAGLCGAEYANFWMGHKLNYGVPHMPSSDEHYFSKEDIEFHRKLYEEKALTSLKLETRTASATQRIIEDQAEKIERLTTRIHELESFVSSLREPIPGGIPLRLLEGKVASYTDVANVLTELLPPEKQIEFKKRARIRH